MERIKNQFSHYDDYYVLKEEKNMNEFCQNSIKMKIDMNLRGNIFKCLCQEVTPSDYGNIVHKKNLS